MPYMTTSEARSVAAKSPPAPAQHSQGFDSLDTLIPQCAHHHHNHHHHHSRRCQYDYCQNQDHDQDQSHHHNSRISSEMKITTAAIMDRKRSHGIGGAGNIRRPSDPFNPPRHDEEATSSRRRSSVWSSFTPTPGSSPEGKRGSFMSFFKKRRASEASNTEEEMPDHFRDVDLGGGR
ncbi:hypothetical protein F5884DRAFT_22068 [Xylogone sp. PMI_703]|nr:hypothetical protein F5884DRAFT_22068 [Xylogone sp. PMI_703]